MNATATFRVFGNDPWRVTRTGSVFTHGSSAPTPQCLMNVLLHERVHRASSTLRGRRRAPSIRPPLPTSHPHEPSAFPTNKIVSRNQPRDPPSGYVPLIIVSKRSIIDVEELAPVSSPSTTDPRRYCLQLPVRRGKTWIMVSSTW